MFLIAPQTSDTATAVSATSGTASGEEALIEAMDSVTGEEGVSQKSKLETPKTDNEQNTVSSTASVDAVDQTADGGDEITIKLKFINDDQKVVTGRPREMLGDFKK